MTQPTQDETRQLRTERLTESEYHEMLAVERRKTTLNIVAESTDIVELNDLAMMVAERETDEVDPERIAVTLHHIHLPKMADAGVINYDPDTTRVEPRP